MKKYNLIPFMLSVIILVMSIALVGQNNQIKPTNKSTIDQAPEITRGVWVSYITLDMQNSDKNKNTFVEKFNKIIETTKQNGFNTLIVQVRPFCDALYSSRYYPWSHILTGNQGENPGYDPLEIMCKLCNDNNIEIHVWINPYRVKTENSPSTLTQNNPYIKDKSIGFEHNGAVYLDPSNSKAQKLIINGVKEIIENYDIDAIQFDDYFYPEKCNDFDNDKYEEYKTKTKQPLSKTMWRAQNVDNLIKEVYKTIHKYSNNIDFGISPQGNLNNNINLGADVKKWCENKGYIDYMCPQIYFSLDNPALTFEDSLKEWQKIKMHNKLDFYVGLAGYKGGTNEDEGTWLDNDDILKNEIEICIKNETDGIMLYSYESFFDDTNKPEIRNAVNYLNGIKE